MTRLRHYDDPNVVRFITFSCYRRLPLLSDDDNKRIFIDILNQYRHKYNIKIYGYVIMPEHVHLVLHPPEGLKLGEIIGKLKGLASHEIAAKGLKQIAEGKSIGRELIVPPPGAFWQRRCYDHNCRLQKTIMEKIQYCHKNPVVRGLVETPGDYFWSSYNWYMGVEDVPIDMDPMM